ncbi:Cytochrome c oxidase assembly protein cox19 [Balamuthia mandrillaris]
MEKLYEREVAERLERNRQLTAAQHRLLLELLLSDPLLADVPKDVAHLTSAHIEALIDQLLGHAFTVHVVKHTGEEIPVVVSPNTTLRDFKAQLKAVITKRIADAGETGANKISWKYVWSHNCLALDKQRLLDDSKKMSEYGLQPEARLYFVDYRPPDKRGRY